MTTQRVSELMQKYHMYEQYCLLETGFFFRWLAELQLQWHNKFQMNQTQKRRSNQHVKKNCTWIKVYKILNYNLFYILWLTFMLFNDAVSNADIMKLIRW